MISCAGTVTAPPVTATGTCKSPPIGCVRLRGTGIAQLVGLSNDSYNGAGCAAFASEGLAHYLAGIAG